MINEREKKNLNLEQEVFFNLRFDFVNFERNREFVNYVKILERLYR